QESLARHGQWPWPRTVVRDLLDKLGERKAAAVGFDILFAEPDRTSVEQIVKVLPGSQAARLADVAGGDPKQFLPTYTGAERNLPLLEEAARGIGSFNWLPNRDGVVRRVPMFFHVGDVV